ncbi:hypothetical protein BTUL_0046g00010 [Botrytis tulipae]|uniref:Uncharacterized protein n=1 Tax=Botrytis tulipae TaxID=87230 RepID=A0A4Z1EWS4_9HELO|nr:hypothetical protein BTUL_0046g00010 [Botrytis tulipae]
MTPLLEEILVELKALRHNRLGLTEKQTPSLPNKKCSTRNGSMRGFPIPSARISEIYENDQVKRRRNDGVVESLPSRIGTAEEQERWSLLVENAWEVPEDGRLKLIFSKRSLLSPCSDTAIKVLEEILKEDRDVPKWFNGGITRIVDIFDDKTTKVYTIDPGASNTTGGGNTARSPIDYNSQNQVTSLSGSSAPSPEVWSGPWRRIMNFWNNGVLHTESNDISGSRTSALVTRKLLESQYHLQATSFRECPAISDSKYWTLLEMNPATLAYASHSIQDLKTGSGNMLFCVFSRAYTAIYETANRWKQILKCFDQSIGEKPAFLDPNYHAKSWAISTLRELRKSTSQNVLQIRKLLEQETSETTTEEELEGLRRVRPMLCSELRNIENIASKLETKQKEAIYLSDESAWSINFFFSYLNLLLTANLLAAATYVLVLNANRLDAYGKFIKNPLEVMKKDQDVKLVTRAQELMDHSERSEGAQNPSN